MSNIVIEVGSLVIAGGMVGVLMDVVMKRQTNKLTARMDSMEARLMTNDSVLGYSIDRLATVNQVEDLKNVIKKQVSCKPKRKKRRGRR